MSKTFIQIPPELSATAESFNFSGELSIPCIETRMNRFEFSEPLSYSLTLSNVGTSLLLTGRVSGQAKGECARCLDEYETTLEGEVCASFVEEIQSVPEDEDDGDVYEIPVDKKIDIEPLLISALVLEFPIVSLCSPDCRGLCMECGANLNHEACEHVKAPVDSLD